MDMPGKRERETERESAKERVKRGGTTESGRGVGR